MLDTGHDVLPKPLALNALHPYLSVVVLECTGSDVAAQFAILADFVSTLPRRPLLRSMVQNPQIRPRVPRSVRITLAGKIIHGRIRRLVEPPTAPHRHRATHPLRGVLRPSRRPRHRTPTGTRRCPRPPPSPIQRHPHRPEDHRSPHRRVDQPPRTGESATPSGITHRMVSSTLKNSGAANVANRFEPPNRLAPEIANRVCNPYATIDDKSVAGTEPALRRGVPDGEGREARPPDG